MAHGLIAIAMCYILIKIPFWFLGAVRSSNSSVLGSLAKGWLAYKTYGLLGSGRSSQGTAAAGSAEADPYQPARSGPDGQLVLPLPGLRRQRSSRPTQPRSTPRPRPSSRVGAQQALFTPTGAPARHAMPPELDRGARRIHPEPGQQHMLAIQARYEPHASSIERLGDHTAQAGQQTAAAGSGQQEMVTPDGRLRAQARPPRPGQPGATPVHIPPGQQLPLPLQGRFPNTPPAVAPRPQPPQEKPTPRQVPGQMPLITRTGRLNPQARPPRHQAPTPPRPAQPREDIRPDAAGQYRIPLNPPRRTHRAPAEPPQQPDPSPHVQHPPVDPPEEPA